MTEHRRARAGRDELAVAGDRHRRRREVVAAPVRDRLATDPPTVDRVVGDDAQRTDRPRLEPVVDDLDARYQRVDVLGDRGVRMATVDWFDIDADAEGELGLDDAMRELVGRERRAARRGGLRHQPAEHRAIDLQGSLRDLVGARDLVADAPAISLRHKGGDHTVLDRVRVGQRLGPQRQRQVGHHSTVRPHVEQLRRRIADHLVVHGEQPAKRGVGTVLLAADARTEARWCAIDGVRARDDEQSLGFDEQLGLRRTLRPAW